METNKWSGIPANEEEVERWNKTWKDIEDCVNFTKEESNETNSNWRYSCKQKQKR